MLRRDLINERGEAPGVNAPSAVQNPEDYAAGPYDLLWSRIDKMNLDASNNLKAKTAGYPPTQSRNVFLTCVNYKLKIDFGKMKFDKIKTKKRNLIFHFDSTTLNLTRRIVENF